MRYFGIRRMVLILACAADSDDGIFYKATLAYPGYAPERYFKL